MPTLHRQAVRGEDQLSQCLDLICANRATHHLPPGGSLDTSAAVWTVELTQREGPSSGGGAAKVAHSRFIVVDTPAIDGLLPGASSALDPPSLHTSLSVLYDVLHRTARPELTHTAPFGASVLTQFLSELIGGDAVVIGLGFVSPSETATSRKTLELCEALCNCINYPIGGRGMSEMVAGLLGKYRGMVVQLMEEIESLKAHLAQSIVRHEPGGKFTGGATSADAIGGSRPSPKRHGKGTGKGSGSEKAHAKSHKPDSHEHTQELADGE